MFPSPPLSPPQSVSWSIFQFLRFFDSSIVSLLASFFFPGFPSIPLSSLLFPHRSRTTIPQSSPKHPLGLSVPLISHTALHLASYSPKPASQSSLQLARSVLSLPPSSQAPAASTLTPPSFNRLPYRKKNVSHLISILQYYYPISVFKRHSRWIVPLYYCCSRSPSLSFLSSLLFPFLPLLPPLASPTHSGSAAGGTRNNHYQAQDGHYALTE